MSYEDFILEFEKFTNLSFKEKLKILDQIK